MSSVASSVEFVGKKKAEPITLDSESDDDSAGGKNTPGFNAPRTGLACNGASRGNSTFSPGKKEKLNRSRGRPSSKVSELEKPSRGGYFMDLTHNPARGLHQPGRPVLARRKNRKSLLGVGRKPDEAIELESSDDDDDVVEIVKPLAKKRSSSSGGIDKRSPRGGGTSSVERRKSLTSSASIDKPTPDGAFSSFPDKVESAVPDGCLSEDPKVATPNAKTSDDRLGMEIDTGGAADHARISASDSGTTNVEDDFSSNRNMTELPHNDDSSSSSSIIQCRGPYRRLTAWPMKREEVFDLDDAADICANSHDGVDDLDDDLEGLGSLADGKITEDLGKAIAEASGHVANGSHDQNPSSVAVRKKRMAMKSAGKWNVRPLAASDGNDSAVEQEVSRDAPPEDSDEDSHEGSAASTHINPRETEQGGPILKGPAPKIPAVITTVSTTTTTPVVSVAVASRPQAQPSGVGLEHSRKTGPTSKNQSKASENTARAVVNDSDKKPSPAATNVDSKATQAKEDAQRKKRKRISKQLASDINDGARRRSRRATNGVNIEIEASMTPIEHLTRIEIDENTGLPVMHVSLFGSPDDTIYDFKFTVASSKIPNSGNGLFCTFLGARRLKMWPRKAGDVLLHHRKHRVPMGIEKKLTARHPDGYNMEVSLSGSDLFGKITHQYCLEPLKAVLPKKKREITVRFSDPFQAYTKPEMDAVLSTEDSKKKIGFLGLYDESDYVRDNTITFSSIVNPCALINLGRYGPFRREDRKIEKDFGIKAFIFNNEPNEWCFGVADQMSGCLQMIDITADDTGEPHDIAKRNIPMYVNEVGHSGEYTRNVYARDHNDRMVHYYLRIEDPMKAGETVECLVDYDDIYEEVRVRKGYGLANLEEGVKGDDHLPTRLERNFEAREDIIDSIEKLENIELIRIVEWIDSRIRAPLVKQVDAFLDSVGNNLPHDLSQPPTAQQVVALRRIQWLAPILEKRLLELERPGSFFAFFRDMAEQCKDRIGDMVWESAGLAQRLFLDEHVSLRDSSGKLFSEALEEEIIEEYCCKMDTVVPFPFDEGIWCGVARDLTKKLCTTVARETCFQSLGHSDTPASSNDRLRQLILRESLIATRRISSLSKQPTPSALAFASGAESSHKFTLSALVDFDGFAKKSLFYVSNTTHEKGIIASAIELRAYNDVISLEGSPSFDIARVKLKPRDQIVMMENGLRPEDSTSLCSRADLAPLVSIPRSISSRGKPFGTANRTWYVVWQVAYLAHAFAKTFLPNDFDILVESLCSCLHIDPALLKFATARGISTIRETAEKRSQRDRERSLKVKSDGRKDKLQKKTKNKEAAAKKKLQHKSSSSHRDLFWGIVWPGLTHLGWTLDRGNRPNDFYFCPPGVSRGKGFKTRVDFFDSVLQVLECLHHHPQWKNEAIVGSTLFLYDNCRNLWEDLKKSKHLPRFHSTKEKVDYLVSVIRKRISNPA